MNEKYGLKTLKKKTLGIKKCEKILQGLKAKIMKNYRDQKHI
jgi:hypothetical protein